MISPKQIVAIFAVLFVATAAVAVLADDSDAVTYDIAIGSPSDSGFGQNQTGTLKVNIVNNNGMDANIKITVKEGDRTVGTTDITVPANSSVSASVKFQLGAGSHALAIYASGSFSDSTDIGTVGNNGMSYNISIAQSFWSGWVPYVVLVIVGLIIALMIYIWSRGRTKAKPAVSFTDLEEGKVSAGKTTEKKKFEGGKSEESSSGRVKYVSDRRK